MGPPSQAGIGPSKFLFPYRRIHTFDRACNRARDTAH
jgi:hypothetical protein